MIAITEQEKAYLKPRYYVHKCNRKKLIKKRGWTIKYTLTFEEFADLWVSSGKMHNIGLRKGGSVLMRIDKTGNYEYSNMKVGTLDENTQVNHVGVQKNRGSTINLGIKRSQYTKDLQSSLRKGLPRPECNRPIQTPQGLFKNIREAAEHYGIRPEGIHYFKRKYPNDYYYI